MKHCCVCRAGLSLGNETTAYMSSEMMPTKRDDTVEGAARKEGRLISRSRTGRTQMETA